MDEAEDLADHVVVIDHGTRHRVRHGGVARRVVDRPDAALRVDARPAGLALSAALGLAVTEPTPGSYTVTGAVGPSTVATLTAWLADRDALVTRLTVGRRTLEDVFLDLTGRSLR